MEKISESHNENLENSVTKLNDAEEAKLLKHRGNFAEDEQRESVAKLESMKNTIEGLSKNHQIEILKILKRNNKVIINENKNGVFINLSFLPEPVLDEIHEYLHFIHDQEDALMTLETQKDQFKHDYFAETEENS